MQILNQKGINTIAYEPFVDKKEKLNDVLSKSDAIVITNSHAEFTGIDDWKSVKVIIDGRNCLDKEKIVSKGIIYRGIGR